MQDHNINIDYTGAKGPLFGLTLKTGLLTVVTLGLYRFWQKTRIRRYIWASVDAGGDRFEYTGTGLEKFLGFLVAVVFLAVYLGLWQILLFFLGVTFLPDSGQGALAQAVVLSLPALAVVPFALFAIYRARRYKMARTRFRGIRLGMEKGAWGYVWRALGYGALTVVSLGALWPLMTFRLEAYMTNHSYFGTTPLRQLGHWTALYRPMKHLLIALMILFGSVALFALGAARDSIGLPILGGLAGMVGVIWLVVGYVSYSVNSFAYLMSHKVIGHPGEGDDIRFHASPKTREVIRIYVLGVILIGLIGSVVFGAIGILSAPILMGPNLSAPGGDADAMLMQAVVLGAVIVIGYLIGIVVLRALTMILITQPTLAHYIDTITVTNPQALDRISQREALTGIDADGFADALDIGGAI
ncbi:YjgN family protein [Sagittula sp. SSi028]|uniref:YjgN family protein n=1 Tax=Sagittula sp. SSi028 TaxID=3400636 RepID=UPI003AF59B49